MSLVGTRPPTVDEWEKGNEAIIDKYSNYIHKAICKQCPTWLREKNDLYQAGCEGIMYALKGYDADKRLYVC